MKILKVDKDKVQVELSKQDVTDVARSLSDEYPEGWEKDYRRFFLFGKEFVSLEEQMKK